MIEHDLAVVGAGPAGLAAAVTAAEHGLRVALIDAGPQPGGQFWRHPDETVPFHPEFASAMELRNEGPGAYAGEAAEDDDIVEEDEH